MMNKEHEQQLCRVLKNIDEVIRPSDVVSTRNRRVVQSVLDTVVDRMKEEDLLFRHLFQRLSYQGSYFEGLRIVEATEFDFNLVMSFSSHLGIDEQDLEVVTEDTPSGFGKVRLQRKIDSYEIPWDVKMQLRSFFDDQNYLLPRNAIQLIQSAIDQTGGFKRWRTYRRTGRRTKVMKDTIDEEVQKVTLTSSGPARTLKIFTSSNPKQIISLDLVPVICFRRPELVNQCGDQFPQWAKVQNEDKFGFVVPKRYEPESQHILRDILHPETISTIDETNRLWRLHFPAVENRIIEDLQCAKPIIRVLKQLRDSQNWHSIASYHLKTVVLLEIAEGVAKKEDWKEDRIAERFLQVLSKLWGYLDKEHLPYTLHKEHNLFRNIKPGTLVNIRNRLRKIIRNIQTNPHALFNFCKVVSVI